MNPTRRSYSLLLTVPLALTALATPLAAQVQATMGPPSTTKSVVVDTLHGVAIADPYRWLEDQEAQETREWIDGQNEYTEALLGELPGRDKITARLTELMKIDVIGAPTARGGRYFFSKRLKDQDLYVIYMREGLDGEDQALIDPHPWSEDHRTSASMMGVSEDGKILIYGVRQGGQDEVEIRFLDVEKRQDLPDKLETGRYFGVSLKPDNSGFYYTRFSMAGSRLRYHQMGTDPSEDAEIFGEGYGPDKIIAGGLSDDGRYLGIIVLHGSGATRTELYYKDVGADGPIETIVNDIDARFFPSIAGDYMLIQTNWEAPRERILLAPLADPRRENWKEIIPERQAVIQGVSPVGGKLFINYLEDVKSRVEIFDLDGNLLGGISFPSIGSVSGMAGRWEDDEAFFAYSSFHIPTTIYRYQVSTGEKTVWNQLDVPIDAEDIEVEQVWYDSKDGTRVPMFLVHRKGVELDGQNPVLLTGYGGFNVTRTPGFSSTAVYGVERGMIYALPNLRGGGEFGEEWHRAGMFENKQNVFDDFIAAAEWLIANGYTSPSKLAISGGSNGGLLVGAAMTQRPDLFQAVVCTYPLLDMVRYHKFLVARFWVSEYGSADDPDQFEYIYKYSPYHNVKPGTEYPATLFITGDSDTRVAPLHARKMAALVQEATASDRPVLLKYDTKSGHSGGTPVSRQIEDSADTFSFLMWQLGMLKTEKGVME
ncbi:MAG: S9 family peptidase [Gemmatimonadota bacterium]|nr:MAG: S9 family peptidase [Gemmatimonadota bacterium]